MQTSKKHRLLFLALILVVAFFGGCDCGDDDDDDDDNDDADDDDTGGCVDEDLDGYGENCPAGPDCNDYDPDTYQVLTGYTDQDGDGYPGTEAEVCAGDRLPAGTFPESDDCDDTDPLTHPGATELPDDGVDQDCVGGDFEASDDNGVFVDAATGLDTNPGTMAQPVLTITKGVLVSESAKADLNVYIAQGTYDEDVVTSVSLFGGYESTGWTRDIDANTTTIQGVAEDVVILVSDGSTLVLEGLTVYGVDGSATSIGLSIGSESDVLLVRNAIHAGQATGTSMAVNATLSQVIASDNEFVAGPSATTNMVFNLALGSLLDYNNTLRTLASPGSEQFGYNIVLAFCEIHGSTLDLEDGNGFYGINLTSGKLVVRDLEMTLGQASAGHSFGMLVASGVAEIDGFHLESGTAAAGGTFGIYGATTNLRLANSQLFPGEATSDVSFGVYYSGGAPNGILHLANNVVVAGDATNESTAVRADPVSPVLLFNTLIAGQANMTTGVAINLTGANFENAVLIDNTIEIGQAVTQSHVIDLQGFSSQPLMVLQSNNLRGTSPDCLLNVGADCITTISGLNNCDWDGCKSAGDNQNSDPLFVDPASNDFHLQGASPLIDAGANPLPYLDPSLENGLGDLLWYDFESDPRPDGSGWDIGADQYTP